MYSTIPIHWNIKAAPASPGRSRAGPSLYVYSLLVLAILSPLYVLYVFNRTKAVSHHERSILRWCTLQKLLVLSAAEVVNLIEYKKYNFKNYEHLF
jgi:hypothetical protein